MINVTVPRLPSKNRFGPGCRCDENRGVAGPAWHDEMRNRLTCHADDRIDDIAHAEPAAGAEVERARYAAIHQVQGCRHVRSSEIGYVDIVADAGSIRRLVVVTEDVEPVDLAIGRHEGARDKVRFGIVPLASLAVGIAAAGIEVTERHVAKTVCDGEVAAHKLHHQFRLAIGVDRLLRRLLCDGHMFRLSIGGTGRRHDEVLDARQRHGAQQRKRACHVVVVVQAWLRDGLAHIGEGREVDHGVGLEPTQGLAHQLGVANVALNQVTPVDEVPVAARKIVIDHDVVTGPREQLCSMAADIAGATCNQKSAHLAGS